MRFILRCTDPWASTAHAYLWVALSVTIQKYLTTLHHYQIPSQRIAVTNLALECAQLKSDHCRNEYCDQKVQNIFAPDGSQIQELTAIYHVHSLRVNATTSIQQETLLSDTTRKASISFIICGQILFHLQILISVKQISSADSWSVSETHITRFFAYITTVTSALTHWHTTFYNTWRTYKY